MKAIYAILASLLVIAMAPAFAAAQTTVDTIWSGAGGLNIDFYAGDDAESHFWTGGNGIAGEFHGKDSDNNPYNYNVDTVDSFVAASVSNGGFMQFENIRLDSKTSMYGNPGQRSYTYIDTDDFAEMSYGSWTNYAEMKNCQYSRSPKTTNGKNFEAYGSYIIEHSLTDADNDGAVVLAYGDGSAKIKLQGETSRGSAFNFGHLSVCGDDCAWDNNYATFDGTGTGNFEVHAHADNELSIHEGGWTIPGDGTDNSATYDLLVGYAGTWSWDDFGVKGS